MILQIPIQHNQLIYMYKYDTLLVRSHDRFLRTKIVAQGQEPGTEIRRPTPRTSTHSHEQSGIPVLSISASMSELTDLSRTSVR